MDEDIPELRKFASSNSSSMEIQDKKQNFYPNKVILSNNSDAQVSNIYNRSSFENSLDKDKIKYSNNGSSLGSLNNRSSQNINKNSQ
jgi:hypothetical protein